MRKQTLIVNMPGSRKAVAECFASIVDVLPHALQHMQHKVADIRLTHQKLQATPTALPAETKATILEPPTKESRQPHRHVCPHKTNTGSADDRNSPFPMVSIGAALDHVISSLTKMPMPAEQRSELDLPPFRASIKDGYAMKASSGRGIKVVMESISAGDAVRRY